MLHFYLLDLNRCNNRKNPYFYTQLPEQLRHFCFSDIPPLLFPCKKRAQPIHLVTHISYHFIITLGMLSLKVLFYWSEEVEGARKMSAVGVFIYYCSVIQEFVEKEPCVLQISVRNPFPRDCMVYNFFSKDCVCVSVCEHACVYACVCDVFLCYKYCLQWLCKEKPTFHNRQKWNQKTHNFLQVVV